MGVVCFHLVTNKRAQPINCPGKQKLFIFLGSSQNFKYYSIPTLASRPVMDVLNNLHLKRPFHHHEVFQSV